jgi:radical SAM superfamily enzyme YgiQ (UPF0313 family)
MTGIEKPPLAYAARQRIAFEEDIKNLKKIIFDWENNWNDCRFWSEDGRGCTHNDHYCGYCSLDACPLHRVDSCRPTLDKKGRLFV